MPQTQKRKVLSMYDKANVYLSYYYPAETVAELMLILENAGVHPYPVYREWGNPEVFFQTPNPSDINGLRPRKFGF